MKIVTPSSKGLGSNAFLSSSSKSSSPKLSSSKLGGSKLGSFSTLSSFPLFFTTLFSLSSLAFLMFTVFPTIISSDTASATSSSSDLEVGINEILSLTIESYDTTTSEYIDHTNLYMDIYPGNFKTTSARVTADTNAPYGYRIILDDVDGNNNLIEQHDSTTSPANPVISSITNTTTIADSDDSTKVFSDNTWGYSFNTGNTTPPTVPTTYSPIPSTTTATLATTDSLGSGTYTFTAGARIGSTLPAGVYKDELMFSIVANAKPNAPAFYTTNYMQDFTATTCNTVKTPTSTIAEVTDKYGSNYADNGTNATIVPSTTLIDKRDGQVYTVRKLADGNCWMTENLRYGSTTSNAARAYSSSDAALSDNIYTTNMAKLTTTYISDASGCGSYFRDSSSSYTTPSVCIYQANTAADYDGETKYGALYNYCAATGGTVCTSNAMSADASGSVCPKGWKLPGMTDNPTGSGATTDGSVKTYNNMLNAYGVTDSSAGLNIIVASPLAFVRAGYAYYDEIRYRSSSVNGSGGYWASTKYTSSTYAYNLYFYGYGMSRSSFSRYYGGSVRCLAS